MLISLWNRCFFAMICLLGASLLAGCEKPVVGVNLHAVNYSGDAFRYYVTDPTAPKEVAGGELVEPFAAGGTTCCFTLPKKWRPGIKVQIRTTHWLPERPDGSLPEVKEVHLVEVPAYVESKPGELWVVRGVGGSMSVISSDFQPDHPKWPGTPKSWPVPSVEYQRERWELIKKYEEGGVRLFLSLLAKFDKSPSDRAKTAWEYDKEHNPSSLNDFSGPDDPRYLIALRDRYQKGLKESQERLKKMMEMRP